MNSTNHAHLPRKTRIVRQVDVSVIGSDATGRSVLQRPRLAITLDVCTQTILGCTAILPTGTDPKKSTE